MFDTVWRMEVAAHAPRPVDHRLRDVLTQLGDRIAPVTMARERIVPVAEPLRDLFVEGGIIRGQVVSCHGAGASSVAFSIVREAMVEGSWLAAVDVGTFGADAASELGVPLERIVRVETSEVATSPEAQVADWVEVMGAAADGFDLVMTRMPAGLRQDRPPASVRKLATRFQQRGAVVVVLGETHVLSSDVVLTTTGAVWEGLGQGSGRLRRRRVDIEATGRRQPGTRRCSFDFVAAKTRVELAVAGSASCAVDPHDPQEQVLAEMRSELAARPDDAERLDHRAAG